MKGLNRIQDVHDMYLAGKNQKFVFQIMSRKRPKTEPLLMNQIDFCYCHLRIPLRVTAVFPPWGQIWG